MTNGNGVGHGGDGGEVETFSDETFLFTSESVGEGHPGQYIHSFIAYLFHFVISFFKVFHFSSSSRVT
jgi:hypothetical protein